MLRNVALVALSAIYATAFGIGAGPGPACHLALEGNTFTTASALLKKAAAVEDFPIVLPSGFACECPPPMRPVWIAPGDICNMRGDASDFCTERIRTDYKLPDHILTCLSSSDLQSLWASGHCHDDKGPFLADDGRLVCASAGSLTYPF